MTERTNQPIEAAIEEAGQLIDAYVARTGGAFPLFTELEQGVWDKHLRGRITRDAFRLVVKNRLRGLPPHSGLLTTEQHQQQATFTQAAAQKGTSHDVEDLQRLTAVYDGFAYDDILALAYLVARTTIQSGGDLERAIVAFREQLECTYPTLNVWRLSAKVARFNDPDMVLALARKVERDGDAAGRYHCVLTEGLLIDLTDAIGRGDLGAINNAAERLNSVMTDN